MPFTLFQKKFLPLFAFFMLTAASLFAAGEVHDGKVSAYLKGAYEDAASVEGKLKGTGFEVIGKDAVSPDLTTIVFTCPTLRKMGNNPKRGFAATMRALVNKKDNEISFTNPLYFGKAYMQKDFNEADAKKVLSKINAAFPGLKDSSDSLKYSKLPKYHFTFGMPYYEDMDVVAKGNHNELLAKLKNSNPVFVLPLSPERALVGFRLSDKTAGFINKIGTKNAQVLPYAVLVEGEKAYILAPKYQLALSYPQLSMGQFMKIASVPGKIEKECKAAFK